MISSLLIPSLRMYFFMLLVSWPTTGWSQSSTEWSQRDTAIIRYANPLPTYREAADTLANYLLTTRADGPITSYLAELYHVSALWYREAGESRLAQQWIDKALLLRQEASGVTQTELARTEYLKGVIFYEYDLYVPAAHWFERSRQTLERAIAAGDSLGKNLNRRQIYTEKTADASIMLGDFARAELLLEKLPAYYETARRHGKMNEAADAKRKLEAAICKGLLYQKQELFAQADAVYQSIEFSPTNLPKTVLGNLAILYGNRGYGKYLAKDYPAAERHVRRAIDILTNIPNKTSERYTKLTAQYSFLAMYQQATGQFSALKETVQMGADAGAKSAKGGKAKQLGSLYTYAALGAAKSGDFSLADSLLTKGLSALTNQVAEQPLPDLSGAVIYGEEELQEWLESKRQIEVLKFHSGNFPEGLHFALAACDKLDTLLRKSWERLNLNNSRAFILKDQKRHVQAAVKIALELYQETQDQAFLVKAYNYVANLKGNILKSRLLGPSIARVMQIPASVLEEKGRLELASLSIEKQLLNNPENSKALRDSLLNLDNQLHQLKSDLRQNSPAYSRFYQHQPFLDPDDIIKHLSQKQQLCEFHLTKDSIFVFSISHGKGLRLITLPKPPELKKEIEKLMAGDPPAIDLYGALLAPVIEEGITRLQFIPDGELWRLPFQSLKTPNGKYLIEEYAISYAYAAPVLLNQNQKRSVRKTRKKYLGYGIDYEGLIQGNIGGSRVSAPRGLQNLKPLPFATSEVQQAAEIMGGEALLNSSVTKSSFLDQAPSADIVHLSMHGLLSMDPLANALVFHTEDSNEYVPFSMAEMLTQRMDPELTVLSSCHTGDGPIILAEGMFSMGSAFTIGGSKSTITSNWEANDAITHDIMIAFYEQLNDGASKDVALQQAIIKHIERGSPAEGHPSNWANLSLNGSTFPLQHHQVNYWRWALSLTPIFLLLIYWFWHSKRAW